MSSVASAATKGPAFPVATIARLVGLILLLAAVVALLGPLRRIAQICGWRVGRSAPVWFHRFLCVGLGVSVRRRGALNLKANPLIVANHVSWLDIPIIASLAPLSFLAKKEIGGHRLGRQLVALQGAVYVDRERRSCIPAVNARIAEALRAGSPVVLFAEATTGDGNRMLAFRSSHFEPVCRLARDSSTAEAVIQPVYLDYSRLAGLPLRRAERPRIAWYGDMSFLKHFFQFCRSGGATCEVRIGAPISIPPGMDRKSAARLAEAAVRALAATAKERVCHFS
jgi:1-acyl-sn-glycerol-3-phosphate acyltransferase